jgi:peptidoglycan/LPS O-acetylase OafA/YrhL
LTGQQIPAGASPIRTRIVSLDGLRGLAAFVVVLHHCLLTSPSFAIAYRTKVPPAVHHWAFSDVLIYTPLHLVWDGPAAVLLFFILSGYVLSSPFASGKTGGWASYYAQRFLRLYVPVWGALLFALLAVTVVARHYTPGATYFVNLHATAPHGVGQAARNATLLLKTGWLDSPLWSLRFEVAFSAVLPLAVWFGSVARHLWLPKMCLCLAAIVLGWELHGTFLEFAPAFGLGVVLAFEQDRFRQRTSRLGRLHWVGLTAGSLILISAYWDLWGLGLGGIAPFGQALSAIGGCGVLIAMRDWGAARRFGSAAAVQWLGKRSFSLYLIHEPIVLTVAFALGGRPHLAPLLIISIPLALLFSEVFFRLVERPSHRLAREVGRAVKARSAPQTVLTASTGSDQYPS